MPPVSTEVALPGWHPSISEPKGSPTTPLSLLPLGSSACLASLRKAAAKLEEGTAWTCKVLLAAGLPVGTRAPLIGEGVRGLTVAVVRVAVESIPREGDFGSWLMPETMRKRSRVTGREGITLASHTETHTRTPRGANQAPKNHVERKEQGTRRGGGKMPSWDAQIILH